MTFEYVSFEILGELAWLTLNRPDQANSLNIAMADEFCAAVALADSDPQCQVLIMQGAGDYFCAGGDVTEMAESRRVSAHLSVLVGKMHEGLLALAQSRLVTVAAVQGPIAGAGLGLMLNADLIVATSTATFRSAYNGLGLTPDCGVSALLPQVVGLHRAADICLAGRVVTAKEALEWGLVNQVVDGANLRSSAEELGANLLRGATQALGPTKRLLTAEKMIGYAAHLKDEAETISSIASHPDSRTRIDSFTR